MSTKYRIHIKAETDETVREELREVAFIITGLREATERSKRTYNTSAVRDREEWEKKADAWINKHKVFYKTD